MTVKLVARLTASPVPDCHNSLATCRKQPAVRTKRGGARCSKLANDVARLVKHLDRGFRCQVPDPDPSIGPTEARCLPWGWKKTPSTESV